MADVAEKSEQKEEEKKPDPLAEKEQELDRLRGELDKAKGLILDPKYQEWLVAQAADKAEKRLERSREKEREDQDADKELERMTPKQFKEALKAELREEFRAELESRVSPVEQSAAVKDAVRDVERCREKFEDYDAYRPDMMKIAQEYPTITAEKAYLLAKAEHPKKGQEFVAKKAAASEQPNPFSKRRVAEEKPAKGTRAAVAYAIEKLGLRKDFN